MPRLDQLFEVKNGLLSNLVTVSKHRTESSIPYIRPASTQHRTIAGWVEKSSVPSAHRHPKHSLFVSTNGEGSHTFAYVSAFEFAANSDVSILVPKTEMSLAAKLFYAKAITLNRSKFSYGRKPKGDRLKSITLPDAPPEWAESDLLDKARFDFEPIHKKFARKPSPSADGRASVRLEELFEVRYGSNLELNHLEQEANGINFIARTAKNNGVSARVRRVPGLEPIEGAVLTVAGGGSVLETFLQVTPFYSGRDLYYLRPKVAMSADEMLYYATCIRANQYKYSYGRQANKTLRDLLVPPLGSIPAWVDGSLSRVTKQIKREAQKIS